MDRKIILTKLEENKDTIKSFGVKKLFLFGSYAKGRPRKMSDIDFSVVFKKGRGNYRDYISLQHFLEDLFSKKIDLAKDHLIFDGFDIMETKIEAKI